MVADEATAQGSGGGVIQGIPPQSTQDLCPSLLQHRKGQPQTNGYPGPQQHQYHTYLHHEYKHRAPPQDRSTGIAYIEKTHNRHYVMK